MAEEAALAVLVALLGQHDLVDEAGGLGVGGGQPRHADAAQAALHRLQQRHEVPHGEDVVFHEQPQRRQAVDLPVEGVAQEGRAMTAEWFYAKGKQKIGPVTEEQLEELVRSGEVSRTDMVWKQGMAKWQPAGAVDGLLPKSSPAQAESPPLPNATSAVWSVWWERLNRNKPAYLSALFALALFFTCLCSPVVSLVFGAFPEGLAAFLSFLYVLFGIGLLVALIAAVFVALVRWSTRAERETSLGGKWEPVSGEGCSLWFYEDGGFLAMTASERSTSSICTRTSSPSTSKDSARLSRSRSS